MIFLIIGRIPFLFIFSLNLILNYSMFTMYSCTFNLRITVFQQTEQRLHSLDGACMIIYGTANTPTGEHVTNATRVTVGNQGTTRASMCVQRVSAETKYPLFPQV